MRGGIPSVQPTLGGLNHFHHKHSPVNKCDYIKKEKTKKTNHSVFHL